MTTGRLLLRDGEVLCRVRVAESFWPRLRGLLGRDGVDGAFLLRPAASVHTIGMRFPIDVAYLDEDLRVLAVTTMKRYRVGAPRRRARAVLETERGVMAGWGLAPGQRLALSPD